jgi:2-C-methyl-D-erythritol 4-phosphate cytidylyltransferase / 2-C-methyl-D-erythritol 2,4-cyclodiphosphate synthase
MPSVFAIVPAGGFGSRLGSSTPKQYLPLNRAIQVNPAGPAQTMLEVTVANLLGCDAINAVLVVVAPDDQKASQVLAKLIDQAKGRLELCFEGGATRRDTVLAGCKFWLNKELAKPLPAGSKEDNDAWVLVHDAARPGATSEQIKAFIDQLQNDDVGGLLAIPLADTVKQMMPRANGSSALPKADKTLDRRVLWASQTPQMFRLKLLTRALERSSDVTDEASAIEGLGLMPVLVLGSQLNFKVTTQYDLELMQNLLNPTNQPMAQTAMRIGQGFDSHALVPGRALILGGVPIPFDKGLLGHSDADALLHAITDALLGATGGGDIGRRFPDTDVQFCGADSTKLLAQVFLEIQNDGWLLGNIDATVIAQAPKLEPYIDLMIQKIASVIGCSPSQINIKAKTNEKLGHLGRGEAIAVHAIALLLRKSAG